MEFCSKSTFKRVEHSTLSEVVKILAWDIFFAHKYNWITFSSVSKGPLALAALPYFDS